ncbi:MAG: 50S ribosomal protein L15 [Bacteroidetes bacterium]|nr:50S ribosomal protein L15 [Bacteroidota bacterium]
MKLHTLKFAAGSRKNRKRVGRGQGSGHGETASKGVKGARSRSGDIQRAWFEGGQMPIQRRLPKYGFTNRHRVEYLPVNVSRLNDFLETVKDFTPEVLFSLGIISKKGALIKILGDGDLSGKVTVSAHAFSESAKTKIEAAGGKVNQL